MIPLLALWGLQGALVCLGEDGHVDVGGGDDDCCHEASHSSTEGGLSVAINGLDDCCVDIVIPTIDARPKAQRTHDHAGRLLPDQVAVVGEPVTIPAAVAGPVACRPPSVDAGPPPALRTIILQL